MVVRGSREGMQQTQWSPPTAGIAACGVGGVILAIATVTLVTDPPGRVMAGIAALGLLVFAGASWRARPTLAITDDALVLRGWFRTQLLWHDVIDIIRISEFRRHGRRVRLLEIETVGGGLIVLSRWDLGTDPLDVLDALTDAGWAGRP